MQEQYNGVGISGIVPTERVRQGYLQALKALAISQHSLNKASCYYDELGILRFFFDRSNQVDFAPCCRYTRNIFSRLWTMTAGTAGTCSPR